MYVKLEEEHQPAITRTDILRLILLASAILSSWLGLWKNFLSFDGIAILAVLLGGIPVYKETIEALRQRTINMEASMTIGALASLAIGELIPAQVIIFFALFAEDLESLTMNRGHRAIASLFAKARRWLQ